MPIGALEPEDLNMCKRVFDHSCRELGLDGSSLENQLLASRILALFQSGIHDEQQLLAAVTARQN
ncbi:hypothetical protein [Mesorhizobium loti]|uniref:hypothetical protein n=1 Tax=Rhizobium loti TaxID=381 RepID=UPI00041DF875|nr:hypothetical protein [Mesorhizobium loti]